MKEVSIVAISVIWKFCNTLSNLNQLEFVSYIIIIAHSLCAFR